MCNTRTYILAAFVQACVTLGAFGEPAPSFVPEKPTAKEILDQTKDIYANCKSYRDTGSSEFTSESRSEYKREGGNFSTVFVRPDRFRFEFHSKENPDYPYILWQSHDEVRSWAGADDRKVNSLGRALIEGSGASAMEDHVILILLFPKEMKAEWKEEFGRETASICERSDARRIVDGVQDGAMCYRIRSGQDSSTTLWIDQKTNLLRRIDYEAATIPNDGERNAVLQSWTVTYEPAVDQAIPESDLRYNSPHIEKQEAYLCTDNVLKVSVMKSGKILLDGKEVTLDELDNQLAKFKKKGGRSVWFYSEARKHREQPMERWQAQHLVCEKHRLAIIGFQKADFSDYPEMKRVTRADIEELNRKSMEELRKEMESDDTPSSSPAEP